MAKYTEEQLLEMTEAQFTTAYNKTFAKVDGKEYGRRRKMTRKKDVARILEAQGGAKKAPAKGKGKKASNGKRGQGVCAQVHAIADKMPKAKRAEVIEACVAKGINPATASTQYQRWRVEHAGH